MRTCGATCISGERRLAVVIRKFPCLVGMQLKTVAGFPAGRLAIKANSGRIACVSEPISRTMNTSIYKVCRKSGHCTKTSRPPTCAAT
eukprot:9447078-Pyramimonas_sp.AAC.1